ncbi:hypothetical protein SDC9_128265 [bioreactor metagenome]|uniref:Uncharacterized protein n=1 Tax=bioreactor metagenome TaxID=1076179 RepID=A0A645CWG7_9ZZZZ
MVPGLHGSDFITHGNDHTGTLMAQHGRENTFRIFTRQSERIGMAN